MADMVGSVTGGGAGEQVTVEIDGSELQVPEVLRAEVMEVRDRAREAEQRVETLERQLADAEAAAGGDGGTGTGLLDDDLTRLLQHEAIQTAIDTAIERGTRADEHYRAALSVLASAEETHKSAAEVASPLEASERTVRDVLKDLHTAGVVDRTSKGRGHAYALDRDPLEERIEVAERQAAISTTTTE